MRKRVIIAGICVFVLLICCGVKLFWTSSGSDSALNSLVSLDSQDKAKKTEIEKVIQQECVSVQGLKAERISRTKIRLLWQDSLDEKVCTYTLERNVLQDADSSWNVVNTVSSDGVADGTPIEIVDELDMPEPQQFQYRVQVKCNDPSLYKAGDGEIILASNYLICLDPGHYSGSNQTASGYVEGDVTLQIGFALQDILKTSYGIDSYLTRTGDSISLGGYKNQELDKAHLSLRGSFAGEKDSNLFLSLHTNANLANANGYPTEEQPISINKPVLIVNQIAGRDALGVGIANEIGTALAKTNAEQGLATISDFLTINPGEMIPWTDVYNDSLNCPGTVFERLQENGEEYYGVLRGASQSGIMGMIVEHGMHTIPEVRCALTEGNLINLWAKADADGIAKALGFSSLGAVK